MKMIHGVEDVDPSFDVAVAGGWNLLSVWAYHPPLRPRRRRLHLCF